MIKILQISPFDYCNNKCWYCPVRYYNQPKDYIKHMPPELLEKIIKNLVEEKSLVDDKLFVYTGMYNEIVLYKYFKEMLEIFRKYGLKTMILSNGKAFDKEKLDIAKEFKDVIGGINFNIPGWDKDTWSDLTGSNREDFGGLVMNVRNVHAEFGQIVSCGVNGNDRKKVEEEVKKAQNLISMRVYPAIGMCDRAGLLKAKGILNDNVKSEGKFVSCRNGNRIEEWLHINSLGKAFICCNDFFFKYEFGDFNTQDLKEIWESEERKKTIAKAKKNLCSKCSMSIWK